MKIFDFIFKKLKNNEIGEPPWSYEFLANLNSELYPLCLKKIFEYRTGEKLPLKRIFRRLERQRNAEVIKNPLKRSKVLTTLWTPLKSGSKDFNGEKFKIYDFKTWAWVIDKNKCKTFNQKIQWLKLYGVTDLMRMCTDKVAVRDYVKEKIGEEYLKPVLQIIPDIKSSPLPNPPPTGEGAVVGAGTSLTNVGEGTTLVNNDVSTYFDQIDFDKLPNAFVIKCNHGCKWQYIIKDKEQFLNNAKLVEIVKKQMIGWLEQEYNLWEGFEMQYKGIEPKILIEPLMRDNLNKNVEELHFYCFNGLPKIAIRINEGTNNEITMYDEKLNIIDDVLSMGDIKMNEPACNILKQTYDLSKRLCKNFELVRADWMIYKNKPYFEELTFSPYSGMNKDLNKKYNLLLGNMIQI